MYLRTLHPQKVSGHAYKILKRIFFSLCRNFFLFLLVLKISYGCTAHFQNGFFCTAPNMRRCQEVR